MINTLFNRQVILTIADALGELNHKVVYVGGATVSLYADDPAAEDVRPTKDIDISVSVTSLGELEHFRELLTQKGFTQSAEDEVICRFRYREILLDVLNTKAIGWSPSNSWFASGYLNKETITIEKRKIQVLPLAYFLASKFEAFQNRGHSDPRMSHDFEDIIYVLDNRINLVASLLPSSDEVTKFLRSEFNQIMLDPIKQEAILGNLYPDFREERYQLLMGKIQAYLDQSN